MRRKAGDPCSNCCKAIPSVLKFTAAPLIYLRILDLEAELGVSTEPHKETLDRLIEEAGRTIQVKGTYTREDAVGILRTIDNVIRSNGLNLRSVDGNDLFHKGLGSKKVDCDDTSFIYLSIADALGLPLAAVSAPQHIFARFMFNNRSYINWETTSAEVLSNDYYLKNLTRDGIIATAYNNRGKAWTRKGNLIGAGG